MENPFFLKSNVRCYNKNFRSSLVEILIFMITLDNHDNPLAPTLLSFRHTTPNKD